MGFDAAHRNIIQKLVNLLVKVNEIVTDLLYITLLSQVRYTQYKWLS